MQLEYNGTVNYPGTRVYAEAMDRHGNALMKRVVADGSRVAYLADVTLGDCEFHRVLLKTPYEGDVECLVSPSYVDYD